MFNISVEEIKLSHLLQFLRQLQNKWVLCMIHDPTAIKYNKLCSLTKTSFFFIFLYLFPRFENAYFL